MKDSKKRKREEEGSNTIITFYAPNDRIFDRVFRDESLGDMRSGVKKKLRVSEDVEIKLVQLREGRAVDLEDEDDFEALRAQAILNHSLDIRVTVSQPNEHTAMPDEVFATESLSLKAKRKSVSFGDSELAVSPHDDTYTPSTSTHAPSTPLKPALIHHAPEEALPNEVSPPRSKRKKKKSGTSSVEMNDHASAPSGEHGSRLLPEITGNRKRKDYLSTSALGKQPIISSETPAISITTNKRKKKDLGSKAPVSSTPTSYVSSKQLQPKGLPRDKGRPDSEADHSSTPSSVLSEDTGAKLSKNKKSNTTSQQIGDETRAHNGVLITPSTVPLVEQRHMETVRKSNETKKPSETTETTKTSETPIVSQAIFFETPVVASTTGHTSLLSVSPAVSEFSAERSSKESTLPTLPTQRPRCSSTKQVPPLRKLYCPICRQSPFHYHYACPIVLGDLDPLEQRVSEMNEEDHSETLMQVMEGHIVSARKRTKAAESSHAVSNSMLLSQELSLGDEGGSGEGSKNVDEESEESSEEGSDDSSTIVKVQSTCLNSSLKPPVTVPLDADTQLEILIRGPVQPSRSILADIPSDSDTSSDSDAMDTEDPEREDQENDRSFRKLEKCLHSNQSSSDEEQGARGDEDEESLTFMDVSPKERISQDISGSVSDTQLNENATSVGSDVLTREDAHAEEQGEDNLPNRECIASDNEVQDTGKAAPLLVMEQQPIIAAHTIVTTMPLDTIQPDLPSVTTKTLAHGVLTSSHSTPQAGSTSRELSQEDPADPIEPADDLVGDTTSTQDEDPIEHDSAVEPMLKPPITKAMKGRQGKVSTQSAHLPILASKVVHPVAPQSASPKKGKGHVGDSRVNDPTNTGVTVYPPAPIQSQQRTPVLAPADVVSTTQPKRRGRPPISQEEKERREAVKKAEKEEKAARAIAARAATKAEKGAKKQAENAERTKNNRKASAKPRKSATVVVKVGQVPTPVPTLPSSSLAVAPPPDSQQTVELPKTPFNPPPQVSHDSVKWTVLSQTPDPESSVVDQLRSSSPSVSVDLPPHPPVILPAAKISQRPVKKSIKQNLSPLVPLRPPPSQFVTPLRPNQPLFLPGTQSQFPDTPVGGSVPSSSQRNIFSPSDAEQNERHPQSQPKVRLATWGGNSRFPRLSQLPSQFLFTPSISSTSTPLSTAEQSALNTGDHNNGDDSESSSSDSDSDDSDSDPDENHIPSNRRAGAIPKTAKGSLSGL